MPYALQARSLSTPNLTLRGIKDYGRLLTLADTVEFLNLVLGAKLTQQEKDALVAYLLCL